jgi:glycosyl transferase family 87
MRLQGKRTGHYDPGAMGQGNRWRNLGVAAGAPAAVLFAAWDLYKWVEAYASDHFHNDLTFYLAAARIGIAHGWGSIYDLSLQQAELDAMGSRIHIAELARYISPPPVAWLALPLTPLPYDVAYWVWSAVLLVALAWTWYLAAPGRGHERFLHLVAAVGWLPVIYGLQLGQPGLLVALGVAGSYALLRSGRQFPAGLALGVIALKPQLAFLIPIALLVSGRYRAFAGAAVVLAFLAVASAINVGPGGIVTYQERLSFAAGVPVNRELTLDAFIGNVMVTRLVQVVIAIWALALLYRLRKGPIEWIFVIAIVGGLLASPYLHLDDVVMLGLAGWLYLRIEQKPRWASLFVLGLVIAAEGLPLWGPLPLIAGELGVLLLVSLMPRSAPQSHSASMYG